jgi:excisionase family DNA binding protein
MANKKRGERLISVDELSYVLDCDPMTVFDMANKGEIPGAVRGKTLRFKLSEIEAWARVRFKPMNVSEVQEVLDELEQEGCLISFVIDGKRRYWAVPGRSPATLSDSAEKEEE